ncbi:MAG: hypothetical protein K2L97_02655 [Muribaculaceae bacterium]|nr:hypothetical protein [Muribaculaceae bacterium]
MITLNIKSVTDEIFALTALRAAILPEQAVDTPGVLSRDNLPALRILVRSAFTTIVTRLGRHVTDFLIEDANPAAPQPYDEHSPVTLGIDFGPDTANLDSAARMLIKRYLEHLLALTVLREVYLPIDTAIAATHTSQSTAILNTLLTLLDTSPSTIIPTYL